MTYGEYFLLSAREGDIEAMKECLDEGVLVDHYDKTSGNTALHMAAANNFGVVVSFLIAHGALLNQQNDIKNTALHWAALCGHIEIVKLLCESTSSCKIDCSIKNAFGRIPMEEAL